MTAFLIANMAPIMFASLVIILLLGYPAAFSLGAVGLIYAFVGIQLGEFRPDFLRALPERVYGVMNNDTLLAIPFFTFMGLVLERSGMAEDLLDTIGQLFGTIRGGLAYAVVFVGALLAAFRSRDLWLIGDFKILTLSLSRVLADRYFARAQYACAAPLSISNSSAARVAADMLQSISRNCLQMESDHGEAMIESLVRIVALAYGLPSMNGAAASTGQSALLVRIRNYILAHLEDEDLCPKDIAAKHGISERYLSKLFAMQATTASRWIWTQRLEAARRALQAPQLAHRKISEIAYTFGFNDMSHFSFAFKKRFGCAPREFRARKTRTP